jgi:hypothetical protein
MLAPQILLREVPRHLQVAVEANQREVVGSIVRSTSSGRIVAHLQEAPPWSSSCRRCRATP